MNQTRIETEFFKFAESERRQPVAAALITREYRFVDNDARQTPSQRMNRCGGSCGASSDDDNVNSVGVITVGGVGGVGHVDESTVLLGATTHGA